MKWFLILLAIGLTASDKLDRTYLPPPGAQFAGGNPGDIQAPLELPNLPQPGTIQIGPDFNGLQEIGANGQPTQVPVTTTSYAFTQTTTYQPIESYETTVAPINPITGLPVQNLREPGYQQNIQSLPGFIQNNGQLAPSYNDNIQPGFISQVLVPNGQPINIGSSTYTQTGNQPLNQYSDKATIGTPGGNNQVLGVAPQQPGINEVYSQYPGDQTNNQISSQYPNQNINPGATMKNQGPGFQTPGVNQDSIQYPGEQILPGQQGSIPSTTAPQQMTSNNLPEGQYIEIGTKGPYIGQIPQETYSGQPINVQDVGKPEFNQGYQGQTEQDGIPKQPYTIEPNILSPGSILGQNIYQPGQNYNTVASPTPTPGIVSSTSAYSSASPVNRAERPQAAGDRNAVILNYENVRTPDGYSYSYDTSNGIHADESGTVGDGTRAQGSYSYTGDDGKVYSVIYTADENGFQPRGDHIPTAPPIPEAIKKVIEQAARDKAAGIIDDGSYDEAKYGYKNYQSPVIHRRPQTYGASKFNNNQIGEAQKDSIRPISGITDVEYDERVPQDQLNDNISIGGMKKPSGKYPSQRPSAKITGDKSASDLSDTQSSKNQVPSGRLPLGEENLPAAEENNNIQLNKINSEHPGPSGPTLAGGVKGTKTQYLGSKIEDADAPGNYPNYEAVKESELYNDGSRDIEEGSPKYYSPSQTSATASSATGKQPSKQRPNSTIQSDTSNTKYLKGKRPQSSQTFNQGDVNDFVSEQRDTSSKLPDFNQKNVNVLIPNQENNQQIDANGYFYNPPQTQFDQTQFPTRFRGQELPSTTQPMSHKMQSKDATLRPFQTPEVYNQPSATKLNKQQYGDEQSTTRKPFMTSRVTTPEDGSDADYDYGEDYTTDQKTDDEGISSTTRPNENGNIGNRRPAQPMQTTRPQYGQRTRVTQKGTVAPSQEPDYYNTVTPGYASTTPSPTQNSRFGSTEAPKQVMKQLQQRPLNSRRPSTSTAVGRPVLSSKPATGTSDPRYQTTSPPLGYSSTTVVPAGQPGYDSRLPYGPTGSTPQNYPTYTTTSSTAIPTTPTNQIITGSFVPSGTPETYQPPLRGTYQNNQQYIPIRSEYTTTGRPERPTSATYIPGTNPTTTPGYYQTTYQQGPVDDTDKPGTLIVSGLGTAAPGSSPTETYQTGYRGSPAPATPESRPNSPIDTGLPGSYYSQPSPTGYEYSRPVYSTTTPSPTIGTTPGSFISSTAPGRPFQEYSTTQRPNFPSSQGIFGQSPVVDGFGRPILSEQRPTGQEVSQYPGTQFMNGNNLRGPGGLSPGSTGLPSGDIASDNLRPMYGGEQSANYPGYYGQPQVVGEDFTGPKQPQRFDPQTGYHY